MLPGVASVTPAPPAAASPRHRPVLLRETLELLAPPSGGTLIDCTVGLGGHTRALLEAAGLQGRVIGIDRDADSLAQATEALAEFGDRFQPVHADYRDLPAILAARGTTHVDGLVADLGFSSFQLDTPERGFSFSLDGPLDMRMDRSGGATAADLLAGIDERELGRLLREYGEEPAARRIARAIVRDRAREPLRSTRQLARLIERVAPARGAGRIHPATRSFQALRIAVNRELDGLQEFVAAACALLAPGARAAFISFHSLEDRAVKQAIAGLTPHCVCPPGLPLCACGRPGVVERVTRKAIRPSAAETAENPRSRSARLRVARRLPPVPPDGGKENSR
jgi:16S rRNA (cytosine1402-N4)-methyltransferase